MTVIGIMLVIGLIVTFLGAALLGLDRKERKAKAAQAKADYVAAQAANDQLVKEGEDIPYQSDYVPNIARLKLAMLFLCQGSLAAIVAIGLFFVNGYVVKIPWYVSLPAAVVYFAICFVMDALIMAPYKPTEKKGEQEVVQEEIAQAQTEEIEDPEGKEE